MITIRKATLQDLPTLLEFEQGIVCAERPYDKTLKQGQINYYDLSVLIESHTAEVVVAEVNQTLVASGSVKIIEAKNYYQHERYAHLGFMYVEPENRGQGLNQMIVDALFSWSREKGVHEVRLDVYAENDAALSAYEKTGFSPYLLKMRRSI